MCDMTVLEAPSCLVALTWVSDTNSHPFGLTSRVRNTSVLTESVMISELSVCQCLGGGISPPTTAVCHLISVSLRYQQPYMVCVCVCVCQCDISQSILKNSVGVVVSSCVQQQAVITDPALCLYFVIVVNES